MFSNKNKHPGEKLSKETIFCCTTCFYYTNMVGEILHHKMVHYQHQKERRLKEEGTSDDLWQQRLATFYEKNARLQTLEKKRKAHQKINTGKYNLRSVSKITFLRYRRSLNKPVCAISSDTNQKDLKNDFEGFPQEITTKGRQKMLDSYLNGFPLPWPVDLKDTNSILDCVLSNTERKLKLENSGSCQQKVLKNI